MIQDRVRMDAYSTALGKAVSPGCSVLDLGAGTGILSLLACRFGASRVVAVEPNPVVRLGSELARANGYSDRITWIENLSTNLRLPDQFDVIVADLRGGGTPLFEANIPTILDARNRLLRKEGVLIPCIDRLFVAPIMAADLYQQVQRPWASNHLGLDLHSVRRIPLNSLHRVSVSENQLLAEGLCWFELSYAEVLEPGAEGRCKWVLKRSGTLHGFVMWFSADLGFGAGFSTAPGLARTVYGQVFIPLAVPLEVTCNECVLLDLAAVWLEDGYLWRWQGAVGGVDGAVSRKFDQSTFAATLFPQVTGDQRSSDLR